MSELPPLECLRYFETAARLESFAGAAREIGVTPAAVSYRIRKLEEHFGRDLFDRNRRSVSLNRSGKACLNDVQHVLHDLDTIFQRYALDCIPRRLNIAVVESVAERWLMPRLSAFRAMQPDLHIELETDLARSDAHHANADVWIAYAGEAGVPPATEAHHESLFEETIFPVCSPGLLKALDRPARLADLNHWPLLYQLMWPMDWRDWFAAQGTVFPGLDGACGFRLCGMLVRAAVDGMGVAIVRSTMVERELQQGTLVSLMDQRTAPCSSCVFVSSAAARLRPEVRAFRDWILEQAAAWNRGQKALER